jgi:hypothetical protein
MDTQNTTTVVEPQTPAIVETPPVASETPATDSAATVTPAVVESTVDPAFQNSVKRYLAERLNDSINEARRVEVAGRNADTVLQANSTYKIGNGDLTKRLRKKITVKADASETEKALASKHNQLVENTNKLVRNPAELRDPVHNLRLVDLAELLAKVFVYPSADSKVLMELGASVKVNAESTAILNALAAELKTVQFSRDSGTDMDSFAAELPMTRLMAFFEEWRDLFYLIGGKAEKKVVAKAESMPTDDILAQLANLTVSATPTRKETPESHKATVPASMEPATAEKTPFDPTAALAEKRNVTPVNSTGDSATVTPPTTPAVVETPATVTPPVASVPPVVPVTPSGSVPPVNRNKKKRK